MKKDIYSKENLESLVYSLIKYLYRTKDYYGERLSKDVMIYSMDKIYYIDERKIPNLYLGKVPVCVEENFKIEDYFEYYNNKTLALSMESRLSEYLYNYDVPDCEEVSDRISKIFEKHGFYYEFGANWYLYAEPKNNDDRNQKK